MAVTVSSDGIRVCNRTDAWKNLCSMKGFPISGEHFRENQFPGTICYYYEVKVESG
jgi:hypothetical protein